MGHKREGDPARLSAIGKELGFTVRVVEPLLDETGEVVRSTAVREALRIGDVTRVSSLLGRNHALTGTVVKGVGRGGPLGFPTANLAVPKSLAAPGDGIYATWAMVQGRRLMAATSIGARPTFGAGERTVEAFILDFEGDLYEREVRLEFVRRLRDEVKFESVRALHDQVGRDVDEARTVLMEAEERPWTRLSLAGCSDGAWRKS